MKTLRMPMGMLYVRRDGLMWKLFGGTFSAHGIHPLMIDPDAWAW